VNLDAHTARLVRFMTNAESKPETEGFYSGAIIAVTACYFFDPVIVGLSFLLLNGVIAWGEIKRRRSVSKEKSP
jgi:hypothetical protein